MDSVHSIAMSGYLKLERQNVNYTKFKDLMTDEYKQFDRQMLTKAENSALS